MHQLLHHRMSRHIFYEFVLTCCRYEANDFETEEGERVKYDPYFLDDPSLTTGKHRYVMNLPCFKVFLVAFLSFS